MLNLKLLLHKVIKLPFLDALLTVLAEESNFFFDFDFPGVTKILFPFLFSELVFSQTAVTATVIVVEIAEVFRLINDLNLGFPILF